MRILISRRTIIPWRIYFPSLYEIPPPLIYSPWFTNPGFPQGAVFCFLQRDVSLGHRLGSWRRSSPQPHYAVSWHFRHRSTDDLPIVLRIIRGAHCPPYMDQCPCDLQRLFFLHCSLAPGRPAIVFRRYATGLCGMNRPFHHLRSAICI